MVGTSEEWTEKTFLDIVREIRKETYAKITYLEGYPKMHGTPSPGVRIVVQILDRPKIQ